MRVLFSLGPLLASFGFCVFSPLRALKIFGLLLLRAYNLCVTIYVEPGGGRSAGPGAENRGWDPFE